MMKIVLYITKKVHTNQTFRISAPPNNEGQAVAYPI